MIWLCDAVRRPSRTWPRPTVSSTNWFSISGHVGSISRRRSSVSSGAIRSSSWTFCSRWRWIRSSSSTPTRWGSDRHDVILWEKLVWNDETSFHVTVSSVSPTDCSGGSEGVEGSGPGGRPLWVHAVLWQPQRNGRLPLLENWLLGVTSGTPEVPHQVFLKSGSTKYYLIEYRHTQVGFGLGVWNFLEEFLSIPVGICIPAHTRPSSFLLWVVAESSTRDSAF